MPGRLRLLLLLMGTANSLAAEGTVVEPFLPERGAYVRSVLRASYNPSSVDVAMSLGWREGIYPSSSPWLSQNHIGVEFTSQIMVHEVQFGSRILLRPTSFASVGIEYRRVHYPGGLVSFEGQSDWSEREIWRRYEWDIAASSDVFRFDASLLKEFGRFQGRTSLAWSSIVTSDDRDSLYLFSYDILTAPVDDIIEIDTEFGWRVPASILLAAGIAPSLTWEREHGILRRRVGVWGRMWPFGSDRGSMRYWSGRARIDFWTTHEFKLWEPRVEVGIAWERNLFQSD